jgi:hypothetical protein
VYVKAADHGGRSFVFKKKKQTKEKKDQTLSRYRFPCLPRLASSACLSLNCTVLIQLTVGYAAYACLQVGLLLP